MHLLPFKLLELCIEFYNILIFLLGAKILKKVLEHFKTEQRSVQNIILVEKNKYKKLGHLSTQIIIWQIRRNSFWDKENGIGYYLQYKWERGNMFFNMFLSVLFSKTKFNQHFYEQV